MNRLDARTIANRRNARKSTGPRTPEGKDQSRLNALRHGLAGRGVAWPGEEQEELDAFVEAHVALERPQDERERFLAGRAALLSWQVLRADRIEAARATARSSRGRHDELERRDREVEALVERLANEPHRAVRSLLRTAEGCDWILHALLEFVEAVRDDWLDPTENARLDALCLPPLPGLFRVSRAKLLAEAICYNVGGVWPNGIPGVAPLPDDPTPEQKEAKRKQEQERIQAQRPLWLQELREILLRRVDEVNATLAGHLATRDPGLELAELTAAFDDSPEGERFRRYQRANLRERRATLQELDAWRAGFADRQARPEWTMDHEAAPEPLPAAEIEIKIDADADAYADGTGTPPPAVEDGVPGRPRPRARP